MGPGDIGAKETREREKVVYEKTHPLRGGCDLVEVALTLSIQLLVTVLGQQCRETIEVAQRRAEIVGNRVGECFELLVGSDKVGGLGCVAGPGLLPFTYIAGNVGKAQKRSGGIPKGSQHHGGPELSTIPSHAPALSREPAGQAGSRKFPLGFAVFDVDCRVEERIVFPDDFFGLVATDGMRSCVPGDDMTFRVQHDDAVIFDAVHHEMKNLIAAAELIFGAPAVGGDANASETKTSWPAFTRR
jgi:hypothetical protein